MIPLSDLRPVPLIRTKRNVKKKQKYLDDRLEIAWKKLEYEEKEAQHRCEQDALDRQAQLDNQKAMTDILKLLARNMDK